MDRGWSGGFEEYNFGSEVGARDKPRKTNNVTGLMGSPLKIPKQKDEK